MPPARALASIICIAAGVAGTAPPALAQVCSRDGPVVNCDDGRRGLKSGGFDHLGRRHAIERLAARKRHHRQQAVGACGSGRVRRQGSGVVPLDDPNAPNKTRCAILDGVSYCY